MQHNAVSFSELCNFGAVAPRAGLLESVLKKLTYISDQDVVKKWCENEKYLFLKIAALYFLSLDGAIIDDSIKS